MICTWHHSIENVFMTLCLYGLLTEKSVSLGKYRSSLRAIQYERTICDVTIRPFWENIDRPRDLN